MKKHQSLHHESEILLPNKKAEEHWDEFILLDANVFDSKGRLASIFNASITNLLEVQGALNLKNIKDESFTSTWKASKTKKNPLYQVTEVGRYAYGYDEHGNIIIWIAGKAGWYVIQPSENYKNIHREMCEAVSVWYFILDANEKASPSPQKIINDCAMTWHVKAAAVEQSFRNHAVFVMANMTTNLEGYKWAKKPISLYLESVLKAKAKAATPTKSLQSLQSSTSVPLPKPIVTKSKAKSPPTMSRRTPKEESKSVKEEYKPPKPLNLASSVSTLPMHLAGPRKRGRPRKDDSPQSGTQSTILDMPRRSRNARVSPTNTVKESPKVLDAIAMVQRQKEDAAALWKFLEKLAVTIRPRDLTMDKFTSQVYAHFQLTDIAQARNYISYQSEPLLKYMRHRRRNKDWEKSPLYQQLAEADLRTPVKARMAKIALQTRDYALTIEMNEEGLEYATSEDEASTPHPIKSSLRPKSGKGSGKKRKSYKGDQLLAGKRKSEFDQESDTSRRSKRRATSVDISDRSSLPEESPSEDNTDSRRDIQWLNNFLNQEPPVVVETEPLIGVEANAPGDVWRCPTFGCMEVIYGASGNLGRSLIEDHIEHHKIEAAGDQEDVVIREMKKTNLPVSNLIKRIREFAAAQDMMETISLADHPEGLPPIRPISRIGVI